MNITLSKNNSVNIVGVYRPPTAISSSVSDIAHLLSELNKSEVILLGDFNINWLSKDCDNLKERCDDLNLVQIVNDPTRPNLKDSSRSILIDLILCNRPDKISASGVFGPGLSDHCPIVCVRGAKIQTSSTRIVFRRNFKHFNEQAFLQEITDSNINHTTEVPNVEEACRYFSNTLLTVVEEHAPLTKFRIRDGCSPWFTTDLSLMFSERDKAWALAKRTENAEHWLTFRQLRNKCTSSLRKAEAKYFIDKVSNSYSDPTKFLKAVNITKDNSVSSYPSCIISNNCTISQTSQIKSVKPLTHTFLQPETSLT